MAENNEQIIQAQIDIDKAVKSVNDLVNVIGKSLKKIDKLSEEVGDDMASNLVPVKDVRAKYKEIEKETNVLGKRVKEAMNIKASIDTKSVEQAKAQIGKVTSTINADTKLAASGAVNMGTAFTDLEAALNKSVTGMTLLNSATNSGTASGLSYGKMALANTLAMSTLSKNTNDYTASTVAAKFENVETSRSLEDLRANMDTYKSNLNKGVITQEEYAKATANIRKEAKDAYGGLSDFEISLNKTSKATKNFFKEAQPLGQVLKSLPGPLGNINDALISTLSSVKQAPALLRSLIATPLGLFLSAAAIAMWKLNEAMENYNYWLNNTKEGNIENIRLIEKAAAVSSRYQQVIYEVGSASGRVIYSMKQMWEGFIDGTSEYFYTNFSGIIDFFRGDGFSEAWSKQRKEVIALANTATMYLKSVKDQEEEIVGLRAQSDKDIAKNRAIIADLEGTTKQQRIEAAKEVKRIEEELIEAEKKLANSRLMAIKIQNSYADSGYEDILKEKQAEAELIKLEAKKEEAARTYYLTLKRINAEKSIEVGLSNQLIPNNGNANVQQIPTPIVPMLDVDTSSQQFDDLANLIYGALNNSLQNIDKSEYATTAGTSIMDMLFGGYESRDIQYEDLEIERLQAVIFANESLLNSTRLTEEERTRIEQENADARMQIADIEYTQRERASQGIMNMLSDLEAAFDQNTIVSKMAASANTIISGIQASQDSFSAMAKLPVVGPALGIAAASASALATAKRVKDIWKVKKGDKQAPSDPSTTAQAVQPNLIRPVQTNMSSSDIELQKQLNQTTRVELVYSDVQSAAKRVQVVQNESSF